MYLPTAKGYFSGCGGMEIGIMQAGIKVIQSLDLDIEATDCMKRNGHYFSHSILTALALNVANSVTTAWPAAHKQTKPSGPIPVIRYS